MNWAQIIQGKRGNLDASKAQIIRQFPSTYLQECTIKWTFKLAGTAEKPESFPHLLAKKRCIDCTLHLARNCIKHPPNPQNLLFSHAFCLKHRMFVSPELVSYLRETLIMSDQKPYGSHPSGIFPFNQSLSLGPQTHGLFIASASCSLAPVPFAGLWERTVTERHSRGTRN